jgi:multicomponent K+:H+ antiporter subunit F
MILAIALPLSAAMFAAAMLLSAWRLLRGPGLPDRILALDTLYINSLPLLILIGIQRDSALYFEVALVVSMLGFVGTVVLSKYTADGGIVR